MYGNSTSNASPYYNDTYGFVHFTIHSTNAGYYGGSGMGSRTTGEVRREKLREAARELTRRTGRDWSLALTLLTDHDLDRFAQQMTTALVAFERRRRDRVSSSRRPVVRAPPPVRPVLRKARACSASSSRTALPPHAHCPR